MTGDCDCEIPAAGVKVSSPWVSSSPPTVVTISGSCYVGFSGEPCGYKSASVLEILEDGTSSAKVEDVFGTLYRVDLAIERDDPSSSELSSIANKTGLPKSALSGDAVRLVTSSDDPVFVGYDLPDGVSFQAFLPSSSDDGYLRFESTSESAVEEVLDDLDSSGGVVVDVGLRPFVGNANYTYRFALDDKGFDIESITVD